MATAIAARSPRNTRRSASSRAQLSRGRQLWMLTVLCCGIGMIMATLTSLYVAAPDLARSIGASQTQLTWIVDAYTVALTGLLLPSGALGDRYGRREMLIAGLLVWVGAAVVLQLVRTPGALIADRVVLGIAAAMILPPTLSLITSTFPDDFRDTAVSIWTASFTLCGGVGVIFTAILLGLFSWRSSFWAVLIAGVAMLLAALTLPTSRDERPPPVDPVGSAIAVVAITALVFGLIDAGIKGWSSPLIIGTIALGVVMCGVFALTQLTRSEPLLDVRLFAVRSFGVSALTVTAAFAGVYGMFFMAMQYQQFVLGSSALKAAVPIASMAFSVIPISLVSTRLTERFGLRVVISAGCLLSAGAFIVFDSVGSRSSYLTVFLAFQLIGAGTGLNMAPCTSAIINNVTADKQGVAAAVNHTTRELGTALGVALLGGVLTAGYRSHIVASLRHLPRAAREAGHNSIAEALAVAAHLHHRPAGHLVHAARLAFVAGIHQTSVVMAAVMGGTVVAALVWGPRRTSVTAAAVASPEPGAKRDTVEPVPAPTRVRLEEPAAVPMPVRTAMAMAAAIPPRTPAPASNSAPAPASNPAPAPASNPPQIPIPIPAQGPRRAAGAPDPHSARAIRPHHLAAAFGLGVLIAGALPAVRRARSRARS